MLLSPHSPHNGSAPVVAGDRNSYRKKRAKEHTLLAALLVLFFLKGTFLAAVFPIFTGQDEARHYNSIQYLNEPRDKTWETRSQSHKRDKESFADYSFSEEILKTGEAAGINSIRSGLYNSIDFSRDSMGKNESLILTSDWKPYNFLLPPDIGGSPGLYHRVAALIEHALSEQNILVRFYAIRIFSVLLGTTAVLATFLIARTIGFSRFVSLLFAALVAFQPKFSMYMTNINYDALLIPSFFFFTWGAVMSLRDGLNFKNSSVMIAASSIGFLTKGTAVVLVALFVGIVGFHLLQKIRDSRRMLLGGATFSAVLFTVAFFLETRYSIREFLPFGHSIAETLLSLREYLSTSITPGRFALSSRTYWGALGWNDDFIVHYLTDILWPIQTIAAVGLGIFFFARNKPSFLPERKFVAFLIIALITLQLAIRLADWSIFASQGSLDLGTPGRYFLPNLATHLILVFVGLGMLVRKYAYFRNILIGSVVLMFFFSLYLTYGVVIPRFYF